MAEHGHSVLCLPPYHPRFNPTELKWGSVKKYVARKNVSFREDDAMKLTEEKFSIISNVELSTRCKIARQCAQNCLRLDDIIDFILEQIKVNLQNGNDTSSSSSSEEEEGEEEVSEEDGEEFSGREIL